MVRLTAATAFSIFFMFWPWAFEGMGQEIIASETEVCTIRIFISEFSSYMVVIVYNINRNSREELGRDRESEWKFGRKILSIATVRVWNVLLF